MGLLQPCLEVDGQGWRDGGLSENDRRRGCDGETGWRGLRELQHHLRTFCDLCSAARDVCELAIDLLATKRGVSGQPRARRRRRRPLQAARRAPRWTEVVKAVLKSATRRAVAILLLLHMQ